MELTRRFALLTCIIVAILLNWLTYITPVYLVKTPNFKEEQKELSRQYERINNLVSNSPDYPKDLMSNVFKMDEREAYLSQLPLNEFFVEYTKGKIIPVSGTEWEIFFQELKKANLNKNWGNRKEFDNTFCFRLDEKPLDELKLQFRANKVKLFNPDGFYILELKKSTGSEFIKLEYNYYDDENSIFWSQAPNIFYPYSLFSIGFIILGFALYIFLPWPVRENGEIYYSRGRVLLGDFATYLLLISLFLIPFFIHHSTASALMDGSTYIFWGLSGIGLFMMRRSAWVSSFKINLYDDGFSIETYKGVLSYSYSEIDNYQEIICRPPLWLQILSFVSIFTGKGGSGNTLYTEYRGVSINFTNSRIINLWYTDQTGRKILQGIDAIPKMLSRKGIIFNQESKEIRSIILPIGTYDKEIKEIDTSVIGTSKRSNTPVLLMAFLVILAIGLNLYYYFESSSAQYSARQMAQENIESSEKIQNYDTGLRSLTSGSDNSLMNMSLTVDQDVEWVKVLGKSDTNEYGSKIYPTKDSGFLILGTSERKFKSLFNVNTDIYIIKLDRKYNLEWEKIYAYEDKDEFVNDVVQLKDGSFVFIGNMLGEIYLLKVDLKGDKKFDKVFGRGPEKHLKRFTEVKENMYERALRFQKEELLKKDPTDYYSKIEAQKEMVPVTVNFTSNGKIIKSNNDKAFTIFGLTAAEISDYSSTYDDLPFNEVSTIKVSAIGDSLISTSHNIFDSTDLKGKPKVNSIEATVDGGFIINAEITLKNDKYVDILLLKFDKHYNFEWKKNYGGKQKDIANFVGQTSDGGYIIIGTTILINGEKIYIVRTNPDGSIIWEKHFSDKYNVEGVHAKQSIDGGFVIIGIFPSPGDFYRPGLYVLKIDLKGNKIWEKYLVDKSVPHSDQSSEVKIFYTGNYICQTSDGGYLITGELLRYFNNNSWEEDLFVMKIKEPGLK